MRTLVLVATILASLCFGLTAAKADPFTHAAPIPAQPGTAVLMPARIVSQLAHVQMQIYGKIGNEFHSVRDGSLAATIALLALAFLYGVVHAAGPGHGKTVVGSYFVANDARWFIGLGAGGLIALLQGVTAIILVFLISLVLHAKELEITDQAALISCVSYGIVTLMGVVLLWRAATDRGCRHSHSHTGLGGHLHDHTHDDQIPPGAAGSTRRPFQRLLVAATGITPCASAIIILLFAMANNAMGIGIAAVLSLSLGMAVTVAGVGLLSVAARRLLVRLNEGSGLRLQRAERVLRLLGSTAIVGCGVLLFLGALSRF
jgi:nickel/cobalt transporter (NicO) family protein